VPGRVACQLGNLSTAIGVNVSRTAFAAPESRISLVPLRRLLPEFLWPEDQFEGGAGLLDRIFATDWDGYDGFAELEPFTGTEVVLRLPGVDGLELVVDAPADASGPGIAFGVQFAWANLLPPGPPRRAGGRGALAPPRSSGGGAPAGRLDPG
jgi:hypothetical protein